MLLKFVLSVLPTIVGGIALAIIFFFAREVIFPIPDISGQWRLTTEINETTYRPFENMTLSYTAILSSEGSEIVGTSEKTNENSLTGEKEYIGADRTRGEIDGVIEKRYFSRDKIRLHIVEHGELRDSTTYHDLILDKKNRMIGKFFSTAADSRGDVRWERVGSYK